MREGTRGALSLRKGRETVVGVSRIKEILGLLCHLHYTLGLLVLSIGCNGSLIRKTWSHYVPHRRS